MARLTDVRAPIDRFLAAFAGELEPADRMDFHVARHSPEGDTWLRVESYATPLLARLVLEEYVIGGRMRGIVVMAFPRPEYELPIFTVQLGGVGDRSIALLDLSPTVPDADLSPLAPIAERHRAALGLEPTETAWLQGICSPHLLHANYRELDEERFVDAVGDYAGVWLDSFYRPGPPSGRGAAPRPHRQRDLQVQAPAPPPRPRVRVLRPRVGAGCRGRLRRDRVRRRPRLRASRPRRGRPEAVGRRAAADRVGRAGPGRGARGERGPAGPVAGAGGVRCGRRRLRDRHP